MQNIKKFLLITLIIFTSVFSVINLTHAEDPIVPDQILGCTDATATNYNPLATQDDSSCTYPEVPPTPEPVSIHLTITNNDGAIFDQDITVTACESDNPASGTLKVTAYCAVLQSGVTSDWNTAWAPGIFLNSINNISGFTTQDEAGLDVYHYWSWYSNGAEAMVGLNQYDLQAGDLILLDFIDPQTEEETTEQVQHFHSSSSSSKKEEQTFNYKKALDYLATQQKLDNTFGSELYTDWAIIAFASSPDYQEQKIKLLKYLIENKFSGTSLTDYERHAMSIMSLNLNPYNTNNINYIEKILSFFDNKTAQFGDENLDTDDIFALIVLQNAGFTTEDAQVQKAIDFILSKQKSDGSWDNNVDITSAGIASLVKFKKDANNSEKISSSLEKAKEYLKNKQEKTGGWENVSSTAWAMNSILALGEKETDWEKNNTNPLKYLLENQDETDGSIKITETENLETKIWKTSYAATAGSGKTWTEIMHEFPKQEIKLNQNQISQNLVNNLTNSNQAKFVKKISKLQKPETLPEQPVQVTETEISAQETTQTSWFRKALNLAKFLFS
jgi:hypothetical protein